MAPTTESNTLRLLPSLLHDTLSALGLSAVETPNELAFATLIAGGLPATSIDGLLHQGIPETDIYRCVIPRRTFQHRRASAKRLTPNESDRAERLARVLALARAVFGDPERAVRWLLSTKKRFDDRRPLDLIQSSVGTKLVEEALLQAYFGNVA